MTTLVATRPAPPWLHDLAAARARYEELLGWPVSVRVGHRQLVAAMGQALDAVSMPVRLGAMVHGELRIAMLAGPVMADPDNKRWTFFTQPMTTIREDLIESLSVANVGLPPRGCHAVIPTDLGESNDGSWRWVEQPQPHRSLPPWFAVIAVTRRLITRH
jgi:hypothetical protein